MLDLRRTEGKKWSNCPGTGAGWSYGLKQFDHF
jgi:hypothetical protein